MVTTFICNRGSAMFIKNWKEHQPSMKSDRNIIWIKVYRRLLEDYGWNQLSDTNKATLLEFWLLASEKDGELPDVEEIAFRLRRDQEFVNQQMLELQDFLQPKKDKALIKTSVEVKGDHEGFEEFWEHYPKKVAKAKCNELWNKKKPNLDQCIKTLAWQVVSDQWQKGFIPNPQTWLNQERWDDQPPRSISLNPFKF